MGRGSSKAGGGGGGLNPASIKSKTDFLEAGAVGTPVGDAFIKVGEQMAQDYGVQNNLQVAELKGGAKGSVLAFFDGKNVAVNGNFMDNAKMETAYKACVDSGYHPTNGNKSAAEAIAAHEYGHSVAYSIGQKLGIGGTHEGSAKILDEAIKSTKHKTQSSFQKAISGYAQKNAAETVAEAMADVYCNGKSAKAESKAIAKVVKKYTK
jgi:hypothetical protein